VEAFANMAFARQNLVCLTVSQRIAVAAPNVSSVVSEQWSWIKLTIISDLPTTYRSTPSGNYQFSDGFIACWNLEYV
jgi:hypothetical protein